MSALLQQMKADSPTVLYMMDEASGAPQDRSGNGFHGTVTGVPGYRYNNVVPGLPGMRLSTTGIYVTMATSLNWGSGQPWSWSGWLKLNTLGASTAGFLVSKGSSLSTETGVYANAATGELTSYTDAGFDEYGQPSEANPPGGVWKSLGDLAPHHLGVTISAANVLTWYFDGLPKFTTRSIAPTYTAVTGATGTLTQRQNTGTERIGYGAGLAGAADVTFGPQGLYQAELSVARIKAHYGAGIRGAVMTG